MNYKEMVELAQERGHGNVQTMNDSVDHISEMLCKLKQHDPDGFWKFMREQHELLYNGHYSPEFAEWDVERMHSTDDNGKVCKGAHWTRDEVTEATKDMIFPAGTTECDKYVAFNAAWHDFRKKFSDQQILTIAYLFFFADEDWEGHNKVWEYFSI